MYLLDSNTVIDYLENALPHTNMQKLHSIVNSQPNISVITQIELLGFNAPEHEQYITETSVNGCFIYDLNDAVIQQTIVLRKQHHIKLPDAIIAATTLVYNLELLTRNINDFNKIENLRVINPHDWQDR